jgi:hypothetical protein
VQPQQFKKILDRTHTANSKKKKKKKTSARMEVQWNSLFSSRRPDAVAFDTGLPTTVSSIRLVQLFTDSVMDVFKSWRRIAFVSDIPSATTASGGNRYDHAARDWRLQTGTDVAESAPCSGAISDTAAGQVQEPGLERSVEGNTRTDRYANKPWLAP